MAEFSEIKKKCSCCGTEIVDGPKRSAKCWDCHRAYMQEHYNKNKPYYIEKAKRHDRKMAEIIRIAKSKPCMDCKILYPYYVMEFDHLGNKEFNLGGNGKYMSLKKILDEIQKCDVVCSNCHKARTYKRAISPVGPIDKTADYESANQSANL